MSHNVSIKGVKITNMSVLDRAVRNLRERDGIQVTLDQCGTFRTYPGQPNKSEFTLHLHGARYDIGFNKAKDGHYEPVFDSDLSYGNPIACEASSKDSRVDREANTIGKLMEEYSACLIEAEAELQGHSTSRQRNEQGELQVVAEYA